MAIRLTGLASGMDTDSMVQELVSAYSKKLESYEKEKTKLEWQQDAWKGLNTKIYSFYTGALSSMRMASSFTAQKSVTVSDESRAKVTAGNKAANGTQTVEITEIAKAGYLTGSKLEVAGIEKLTNSNTLGDLGITTSGTIEVTVGKEVKTIDVSADTKIADFVTAFAEETGLAVNFDMNQQRFIINSETGEEHDFNITGGDEAILKSLGLSADKAVKQDASDAEFIINNATYTSSSNTIEVNGLTVQALAKTTVPLTVNVNTDVDATYGMIKNFFKGYNDLINEMTKSYNASAAKGYEPLTDEEKEAMSESEIEKWEQKIKDSLFRRDSTLSGIMSALTTTLAKGIEVDGKTYYLSDFGIETQGFLNAAENEQNAYHIAGDKDDSASMDKTDKLRAKLNSDPELVQKFFNGLANSLYSTLTTRMQSTTLSSAYTIYNDKEMKEEMNDLEDTIDEWEERVADYEDYWFDKFSAMEKALAQLQQETSSLTSLLGG